MLNFFRRETFFAIFLCFSSPSLQASPERISALALFEQEIRTFAGNHDDYIQAIVEAMRNSPHTAEEIITYGKALNTRKYTLFRNRRPLSVKLMITGLLETRRSLEDIEALTQFNVVYDDLLSEILGDSSYYAMVFTSMIAVGLSAEDMKAFVTTMESRENVDAMSTLSSFERAEYMVAKITENSVK